MQTLSVELFETLPDDAKTICINSNGFAYGFSCNKRALITNDKGFCLTTNCNIYWIGHGYDASNWRNSVIEKCPV